MIIAIILIRFDKPSRRVFNYNLEEVLYEWTIRSVRFSGNVFWIISAAMVAATFFFWVERDRAVGKWKTSLTVAAMVTGIAAIHYFYMRGVWADTGETPLVFRYVDWLLTVPLQIVEFYLILAAIAVVPVFIILEIVNCFSSYAGSRLFRRGWLN